MLKESVQQYKDYFESDEEEADFFQVIDDLPIRDRIRFMEVFEDYTVDKNDYKNMMMIKKREFNPELSTVQNMVFDLIDFKDRVRPMCKDMALVEAALSYQKENVEQYHREREIVEEELD